MSSLSQCQVWVSRIRLSGSSFFRSSSRISGFISRGSDINIHQQDLQNLQKFRFNLLQDYLNVSKSEGDITGKQAPSEFEINMINSLRQGIFEINEKSVNSDQDEVDQELQLLQDLRLQEWYQGDLQGYSEKEVKEAIKKELISLSSSGHKVIWSRTSQTTVKRTSSKGDRISFGSLDLAQMFSIARFVGKGFTDFRDKEAKYAHTPLAMTLKIMLMTSQLRKCQLSSVRWHKVSRLQWMIQKGLFMFRHLKIQLSRANCLASQASVVWSQRFTEIMADPFDSGSQKDESFTDQVRSLCFHRIRI